MHTYCSVTISQTIPRAVITPEDSVCPCCGTAIERERTIFRHRSH